MQNRQARRWIITYFIIIGIVLGGFGGFNYFIDPLWNFSHANSLNQIQKPVNERQQKTNRLTYGDNQYDTLVLGSSRMTYVNQHDFVGYNAYNYAVALVFTSQFNEMIEYAKKANGKSFDTIVLGLDLYSSNLKMTNQLEPITPYIEKTNEPFYRYKTLLSLDTFRYSLESFNHSRKGELFPARSYDRNNVATAPVKDPEQVEKRVFNVLERSQTSTFDYNPSFKQVLAEIKRNNPDTTFIPLTTPVTAARFANQMGEKTNLEAYERWIHDIVDVFGSVYNFMDVNTVTSDLTNYFDTNHFYPHVGTLIAHRVIEVDDPAVPSDFGKLVTKENVDEHLEAVEERMRRYRQEVFGKE